MTLSTQPYKGALYFDVEFGLPNEWASIANDQERELCINSIERSLRLNKPCVPLKQTGQFYGYDVSGDVQSALKKRLGDLL